MPDDHYVARTYLKHFAGDSGKLRAYRKSDGKTFPCASKDICKELDGDTIPEFITDEKLLGKYRAIFEGAWNPAVEALEKRVVDRETKLHVAGYWANLLIGTPTWKRTGIDLYNRDIELNLRARAALARENGQPEELLEEGIRALDSGQLRIGVEGNYIRARGAMFALKYAWKLYNADWRVYVNQTTVPFITSDNPCSFEDDPTWGKREHALYLPITPKLCVTCDLTKQRDLAEQPDFTKAPKGMVIGNDASLETVRRINVYTAKSAEDLIITAEESEYAQFLATTYAKYHVEHESQMVRTGNAYLIGHRSRVIPHKPTSTAGRSS
ncbi:hypothetical protein ACVJ19_005896 [Bradyrhizobium sp. USDA 376]